MELPVSLLPWPLRKREKRADSVWFRIYLVGFPSVDTSSGDVPVVDMIERVVPEAHIVLQDIFCNSIASAHQSTGEDLEDASLVDPSETFEQQAHGASGHRKDAKPTLKGAAETELSNPPVPRYVNSGLESKDTKDKGSGGPNESAG